MNYKSNQQSRKTAVIFQLRVLKLNFMEIRLENGKKLLDISKCEDETIAFFIDTERTGNTIERTFFLTKQEAMKIIDFLITLTNEKP